MSKYKNRAQSKVRQTITLDKNILDEAKKSCDAKHIPLSGVIENFLEFFVKPWVYCFRCGEKFYADAELCAKCGWLKCPKCGACRCGLDDDTAVAVFHMRRVYEDLLSGRVKKS
jgi:hypothetical protein